MRLVTTCYNVGRPFLCKTDNLACACVNCNGGVVCANHGRATYFRRENSLLTDDNNCIDS